MRQHRHDTLGWTDIVVTIFCSCILLSVGIGLLYLALWYIAYLEIDVTHTAQLAAIFIITASLWRLTTAYCQDKKRLPGIMTPYHVTTASIGIKHTQQSYQLSPTNDKMIHDTNVGLLHLTEDEKKDPATGVLSRVIVYFIRIFHGPDDKNISLMHQTSYTTGDGGAPVLERKFFIGRFTGESDYLTLPEVDSDEDTRPIVTRAYTYNNRIPTTIYKQVDEYLSGHQLIHEVKVSYKLNK